MCYIPGQRSVDRQDTIWSDVDQGSVIRPHDTEHLSPPYLVAHH